MGERPSSSLAPLDDVRFDPGQLLVAGRPARVDRSIRHSPRRQRLELLAHHFGHPQGSDVITGVVKSGTFCQWIGVGQRPPRPGLLPTGRADCILMVRSVEHGDAPGSEELARIGRSRSGDALLDGTVGTSSSHLRGVGASSAQGVLATEGSQAN